MYISRHKRAVLNAILRKKSSDEDKINRIMAIDFEKKNEELCDYVVEFNTYDQALEQLRKILGITEAE